MPSVSYQVEPWPDCREEAARHWHAHWAEVGQDKERLPLDPDLGLLDLIHAHDRLHIVTARAGAELVGYHASFIEPLLHYRTVVAGKADLYWLHPDYRRGWVAINLFREVERSSRARGVSILYDATKLAADCGAMFEYLGYRPVERRYSKWLGA